MLDFICEQESVWEHLAGTGKPIVLYGMGNGADKILEGLAAAGKKVAGIFASDEFVRGQKFHGLTVQTYAALKEQLGDFVIVLAFASERPEVLKRFYELAAAHEVLAPHVPVFAGDEVVTRKLLQQQEKKIRTVYEHLADEQSREVFAGALNYKLSGKISYLEKITTGRRDDLQTLLKFGAAEIYVDGGAYNGDTVQEFRDLTGGRYAKIYACEPDTRNFKKLQLAVQEQNWHDVKCVNKGLWSCSSTLAFSATSGRQAALVEELQPHDLHFPKLSGVKAANTAGGMPQKSVLIQHSKAVLVPVISLDELLGSEQATYIKLDVEGAELAVIEGATRQLAGRPQLFIAAYHHDRDLWELPLALWQAQPAYKIGLRKHPYVPDWELNFIAY